MRTFIPFLLIIACCWLPSNAQNSTLYKPAEHPVIIDTDCAPDDFRALNYFLSDRELDILAITSTDGTLEPEEGYLKIRTLLNDLGHEGIPSSQGIIAKNESPAWRSIAKSFKWGKNLISYSQPTEIKEFLVKIISDEQKKVDIICMGPLTNIANAILMKPSIKQEINRIIWFDQCQPGSKWTNYGMDCLSADYILNTQIPVFRIKTREKPLSFNKVLLEKIKQINSPYAQKIYHTHSTDSLFKKIEGNHLKLWDDLSAMYYFHPEIFQEDTTQADTAGTVIHLKQGINIQDKITHILNSFSNHRRTVMKAIPTDTSHYQADLAPYIKPIIEKHGIIEWEAAVIANEMHHHLGLYSVIGVKMGIRALNYFHALPEDLNIVSYCGTAPPQSCMNDGLQVATGSTTGNGKFQIKETEMFPKIKVTYKNQIIEVEIKNTPYKAIQQIITEGKKTHGLGTEAYWSFIREQSLQKWLEMDRQEIFDVNTK